MKHAVEPEIPEITELDGRARISQSGGDPMVHLARPDDFLMIAAGCA